MSGEVFASVGINTILQKVTDMERTLAVMACDLSALRKTTTEEIGELRDDVDVLKADRWPWMKIGGLVAVAGLVASVVFGILAQQPAPADHRPPPPRPTAGP